jgi:hypothetical protein
MFQPDEPIDASRRAWYRACGRLPQGTVTGRLVAPGSRYVRSAAAQTKNRPRAACNLFDNLLIISKFLVGTEIEQKS